MVPTLIAWKSYAPCFQKWDNDEFMQSWMNFCNVVVIIDSTKIDVEQIIFYFYQFLVTDRAWKKRLLSETLKFLSIFAD